MSQSLTIAKTAVNSLITAVWGTEYLEQLPRSQGIRIASRVNRLLQILPPREEFVIRKRFFESLTLRAIGQEIGISRERVRQIQSAAIHRLRRPNFTQQLTFSAKHRFSAKTHEQFHLDRTIKDLDLSTRTYNCLDRANIRTIGELLQTTKPELLAMRNFGLKSLEEIKKRLIQIGPSTGAVKSKYAPRK